MRIPSTLVFLALSAPLATLNLCAQAAQTSLRAELSSIGPIAFAPDQQLLVSDPKAATIYAFDVSAQSAEGIDIDTDIEDLGGKIAALVGTSADDIRIIDLAVNPADRQVYLSIQLGQGKEQEHLLMRAKSKGELEPVFTEDLEFTSATLPNPPEQGSGRRGRNRHLESITDMAFLDGRVIVAGLSNEEFASKLRSLAFPFDHAEAGTSIEIYHGSHGRYETNAPVRTFVPYEFLGEPCILAAYTCTPLVVIPLSELKNGERVGGKTVAELGNHNRPLDMISYRMDGTNYLLMANSSRGIMKVDMTKLDTEGAITSPVEESGGLSYETVEGMKGVVQLDKFDAGHAVVLIEDESGKLRLRTVKLP